MALPKRLNINKEAQLRRPASFAAHPGLREECLNAASITATHLSAFLRSNLQVKPDMLGLICIPRTCSSGPHSILPTESLNYEPLTRCIRVNVSRAATAPPPRMALMSLAMQFMPCSMQFRLRTRAISYTSHKRAIPTGLLRICRRHIARPVALILFWLCV